MSNPRTLTIRLDDMYSIDALTNTQADFFEGWKKKDIQVLNEVVDGTFDECFVSLNYLKKKYDSKK